MTLNKEWLHQTIAQLEEERDATPGAVNEDAANALAAMKRALASLEAEPVITVGDDGGNALAYRRLIQTLAPGTKLYTSQPAPVSVPDEIRLLQSEVTIWKDRWELLRELFREVADALGCDVKDNQAMLDKIEMLQGAELVTTAYKLPAEAAYGYFAFNDHHGEEFFKNREDAIAFCKEAIEEYRQENAEEGCDPDEVRRTCWGIIMQEGTDIEVDSEGHIDYALTPELDGNSPVIQDGWVACSERMPKKGEEVLCTDQFENYETALYDTGYIPGPPFFATTAGEFHPTHWMPLPAAPQQEAK